MTLLKRVKTKASTDDTEISGRDMEAGQTFGNRMVTLYSLENLELYE